MSSYAEWFVRLQNNPAVMQEVQEIQQRKKKTGYDPDLTTVVKGPALAKSFKDMFPPKEAVGVDASDLTDLFSPDNKDGLGMGADGLECSFCHTPLQRINSTSEKRPKIRVSVEAKKDNDTGEIYMEEKIRAVAEVVHACPKCSLQIQKPIIVSRV